MKKKYIILVVSSLFLLVLGYFEYKIFNLYYYDTNDIMEEQYVNFLNNLENKNTITINTNLNVDDYLTFKNIKIRNDFEEFKKIDESNDVLEYVKYVLYDENEKGQAGFVFGISDTYVNMLKEDVSVYGSDIKKINDSGLEEFFNENNINNDIELFEYLKNNKDVKNNIFTSVKQMKNNYTIHLLSSIAFPSLENYTLIEGDYVGYIFNSNKLKEVNIIKNNKRYIFSFINLDYFNEKYINELLNTVIID
ncbi:MAG: hypothetical protein IJO32_01900 [Bacilli bacterium]|nr:hypothetical protein [Bacilli bacterium]